jgi:GDP-L-fucose synthase
MFKYLALDAPIFVAGHRGLAGSAIVRELKRRGYGNLILRTHAELDLTDQDAVFGFFDQTRPAHVFLAAGKGGGILASHLQRAEFIYQDLMIQSNVIDAAYRFGVDRLLFLGSFPYPRDCPQPVKESYLLCGPPEALHRPGALATLAGVEMCWSYNRQYGTRYLATVAANLYGAGGYDHAELGHVIPSLLHRAHQAKLSGAQRMQVWGSGAQRREFIYSEDLASACVFLLNLEPRRFEGLLPERFPPLVNIGAGQDISIRVLAEAVCRVVGYHGELEFDQSRPDGAARKLLDVSRLTSIGWQAQIGLSEGLERVYRDYCRSMAMVEGDAKAAEHEL